MAEVTEGFSYKNGILSAHKDRRRDWKSLAGVMQPGDMERTRISYYHDVAVGWMQDPAVDVLSHAQIGVPRFAIRVDGRSEDCSKQDIHPHNQCVHSYDMTGIRPMCPPKPSELSWSTQVASGRPGEISTAADVNQEPLAPESYSDSGRVEAMPFGVYRPPTPPKRRSIFIQDAVPIAVPDVSNTVRIEYVSKKDIRSNPHQQRVKEDGTSTCASTMQCEDTLASAITSINLPPVPPMPSCDDPIGELCVTTAPPTSETSPLSTRECSASKSTVLPLSTLPATSTAESVERLMLPSAPIEAPQGSWLHTEMHVLWGLLPDGLQDPVASTLGRIFGEEHVQSLLQISWAGWGHVAKTIVENQGKSSDFQLEQATETNCFCAEIMQLHGHEKAACT